jgi:glycosyltransferase involved in cell wall biosynthesis
MVWRGTNTAFPQRASKGRLLSIVSTNMLRLVPKKPPGLIPSGVSHDECGSRNMPFGLALIVGQLVVGGAEQQLYHLLSGLDRSRFRLMVISLGARPDEYWAQPIKSLGIPLWYMARALGRAGRVRQIASLLRSEKMQIVHGWDLHTNAYAAVAGRLAGISLCLGSMRLNYEGLADHKFLRWIGYRGLDFLIANSARAADQVRQLRLTRAPVRVVPNGVHIPPQVSQAERSRLKAELGFSDTPLLIGSIGRMDGNKNHAMLLQIFAALTEKWPALRLVIIGDGPLKSHLAAMAAQLGVAQKICLPGSIPRAARYLQAMDVFCLTSHTEGMPNVVMEAAAAGVPVVSTTCGGSVELIECGVTGFLVSPNDAAAMSKHVDLLLANAEQRRSMGQAGREKMCRAFSVKAMVTRMTRVYEEALAARGLGGWEDM